MKKRWGLLFAIVVLGFFVFWRLTRDSGPAYEGKTVSQWFHQYYNSGSFGLSDNIDHLEAQLALTHLSSNAVPFLYEEARNPRRDTLLARFNHEIQRLFSKGNIGPYIAGTNISAEASFAMKDIKPNADLLFPLIQHDLQNPDSVTNYSLALWCLGTIGDGAERGVPFLTAALRSTNVWIKGIASQSLSHLGPNAKSAIPEIIEALKAPRTTWSLYTTLASIGPEATNALPLLEKKLLAQTLVADGVTNMMQEAILAATAIYAIDPAGTNAPRLIRQALRGTPAQQNQVAWALKAIGPRAAVFTPEMSALAQGPDSNNSHLIAIDALQAISPPAAAAVLREKMNSADQINVRLWAAGWLLRINSMDNEAIAFLKGELKRPSQNAIWVTYSLEQLGEVSPAETESVQLIQSYTNSPDEPTRTSAKRALKKIRLKQKKLPGPANQN